MGGILSFELNGAVLGASLFVAATIGAGLFGAVFVGASVFGSQSTKGKGRQVCEVLLSAQLCEALFGPQASVAKEAEASVAKDAEASAAKDSPPYVAFSSEANGARCLDCDCSLPKNNWKFVYLGSVFVFYTVRNDSVKVLSYIRNSSRERGYACVECLHEKGKSGDPGWAKVLREVNSCLRFHDIKVEMGIPI